LSSGSSYAGTVNVTSSQKSSLKRIKPGDPGNNYLLMKIQGSSGITGGRMPLNGSALSNNQVETIQK